LPEPEPTTLSGTLRRLRRIPFAEECRIYRNLTARHWPLIISLGLLLMWLYLFPFQGSVVWELTAGLAVNAHPLMALFLTGTVAGLLTGAWLSYRFPHLTVWLSLAALPGMAASALLMEIPERFWWLVFIALGFLTGVMLLTWGYYYITTVPADRKTRLLAAGALLSGVFSLALHFLTAPLSPRHVIIVFSLVLAGLPVFAIWKYRQNPHVDKPEAAAAGDTEPKPLTLRTAWPYGVIIGIASLVSGLTQVVIHYSLEGNGITWLLPGWIPFFLLLLCAGSIGDRKGLRRIAYIGVAMTGVGLMAAGFLRLTVRLFVIQGLASTGYAFLDTFSWVVPAALAGGSKKVFTYAGFMSVYMLANLTGVLIGSRIIDTGDDIELITISLSGLLVIVSMLFVTRLKGPAVTAVTAAAAPAADIETALAARFNLTKREREIARLLLAGASTGEIQEKTFIADTTLKSHLRNIYRKAGVRNRLELTLGLLNTREDETKE
jgi:DNA-binding CsgD family transcriptional regulator